MSNNHNISIKSSVPFFMSGFICLFIPAFLVGPDYANAFYILSAILFIMGSVHPIFSYVTENRASRNPNQQDSPETK
jgi:hypothetical protein